MIYRIKIEELSHTSCKHLLLLKFNLDGGSIMKYFHVLLSLFIVLNLTGCGAQNNAQSSQNEKGTPHSVNVKNSTISEQEVLTGQETSKHLATLASDNRRVNDATAVVLGDYCIVGIDIDEDVERSEVGSIKYAVAESLKHDPYGANAVIIADPDLYARLKEVKEDVENGHPIKGILNELADISGRMMPEVPGDIIEPNKSEETEESKEQLNETESKKLNKHQEEQSNYHK